MPSGHTTFTFAGLLAIANFFKKKQITAIAIVIASIVGISRILILDHYVSDVILATYIGIFCYLWTKAIVVTYNIDKMVDTRPLQTICVKV